MNSKKIQISAGINKPFSYKQVIRSVINILDETFESVIVQAVLRVVHIIRIYRSDPDGSLNPYIRIVLTNSV